MRNSDYEKVESVLYQDLVRMIGFLKDSPDLFKFEMVLAKRNKKAKVQGETKSDAEVM